LLCCGYVGISLEVKTEADSNDAVGIKTEADSNDITEFTHDDKPGTRVFGFTCGALFNMLCVTVNYNSCVACSVQSHPHIIRTVHCCIVY